MDGRCEELTRAGEVSAMPSLPRKLPSCGVEDSEHGRQVRSCSSPLMVNPSADVGPEPTKGAETGLGTTGRTEPKAAAACLILQGWTGQL